MAVGVVAEYNPFHKGHLDHIKNIRSSLGEKTPVIAVLSGDFVQRGEAAVFSKFTRAEAAVRCGVSLVLELPLPWCLASAEGFARGGIGVLTATGVVDTVSFGSESADTEALRRCAEILETDPFKTALREELRKGISFASARERAAASLIGAAAGVLRSPNDLLGVEYIRTAATLGVEVSFLPVKRESSSHDRAGSAASIRSKMAAEEDWLDDIPAGAADIYRRDISAGGGPVLAGNLRQAIMSRLRMLDEKDLALLPDTAEGLEHRLYRAIQNTVSPEDAAMAAKTKRYALSRLRRMIYCAALGVRRDMAEGIPPYIRVLAMDEKGASLLKTMRGTASLPVITKPAHVKRLDDRAAEVFELTSRAHDLYVLGIPDEKGRVALTDWRACPAIV